MNIIETILDKILHPHDANAEATSSSQNIGPVASPDKSSTSSMSHVDIDHVLSERAMQKREKLNWQTSIVDLMKLLDMDSSVTARKQLAKELNYTGDTNDSASMNIWLQKQVLEKFAENGAKIPDSMKH